MTRFYVEGMVCSGCEQTVNQAVMRIPGVRSASADYHSGALEIDFAPPCTPEKIEEAVRQAGYEIGSHGREKSGTVYWLIILVGLYIIARQLGITTFFQAFPTVTGTQLGYVSLFLIGLMTSVHCVAMCGGMNAAQSIRADSRRVVRASLLYNAGRLVSYTLIGGILGLIGEKAAISLGVRSIIGMAAGVWMLLMGVKMMTGFSWPRRFRLTLPAKVQERLLRMRAHGSFAIGLANGLMPCGPLQSMQLYAIASGSFVSGAASMFCFCLGTVPLVLLMGAAAEWLKKSWKRRMLQFGSALLVLMGLHTLMNNLALSGVGLSHAPSGQEPVAAIVSGDVQYVTTELRSNGFDSIRVQAGIPVVWTIHADAQSLNGCNNEVVVPAFGMQAKLGEGDTQLVFTPTEPGTYLYSCWMGMLKSTIVVTENEQILHSEAEKDA